MKILVYLGHPAHYHLYKNAIVAWENKGYQVFLLIKKKDILEELLRKAGLEYHNILSEGRKDSKLGILIGTIKRAYRLFFFCIRNKPDILTGTSVENSFVGKILNIPIVNLNEDDASVVPLYAKLSYPWATSILNPSVCNSGKWDKKAIKYESYQELAYLHPNHFRPDQKIVAQYFNPEKSYFILRFARLNAHHDAGIQGIGTDIAQNIIDILKPYGDIYITSERKLEPQFEQYRIKINPLDMHHVLAFAQIYIGDSQTMAAEAGVLGVPFVRFNDFVGRIGYLRELEDVYHLGYGIRTSEVPELYEVITELITMKDRKEVFSQKRKKMLSEKIDYAQFLTWFIENYPESVNDMKTDPNFQYNFR
ncbi:MAG: DUF354 domain-containing protein [Paludibacter sp.]|nr:DUF354 domain-containing protein [Paludibacter sp.]